MFEEELQDFLGDFYDGYFYYEGLSSNILRQFFNSVGPKFDLDEYFIIGKDMPDVVSGSIEIVSISYISPDDGSLEADVLVCLTY